MRLDAHQHFWQYQPAEYPWIQPDWPIRKDFLPPDFEPSLNQAGLDSSIAVQARQTLEESRWLLRLADANPRIVGVVGWVDLRSDQFETQLAGLASHPKFLGVRHVVQDEPDAQFMLQPAFLRGLAKLRPFDLTYDLLVFPKQLPAALEVVNRFPEQPFVLDHIAKPPVREAAISPWREHIRELAEAPNVCCKVSGLVTEANWSTWRPQDFRPYLDVILEAFGPRRLMFGSDWPVCLLAASYRQVFALATEFAASFSPDEQVGFFGENAARFYGVPS